MGRPASGEAPETEGKQIERWNTHIALHARESRRLPSGLDPVEENPSKRQKTPTAPKMDTLKPRPEDPILNHCIDIANSHIQHCRDDSAKAFPAEAFEPQQPTKTIYYSNSKSILLLDKNLLDRRLQEYGMQLIDSDLADQEREKQDAEREAAAAKSMLPDAVRHAVPLKPFEGSNVRDRLMSLFSAGREHFDRRWEESKAIEAEPKPNISRYHIAKLLWLQQDPRFPPCINASQGACAAQLILQHPLAPDCGMMAYLSPQDYLALQHGTPLESNIACNEEGLRTLPYANVCEFCYRSIVQLQVEEVKFSRHSAETEIPSRYYAVGPGEYSWEGMYQQREQKNVRYSHGIIGSMRIWNTRDFVPVMGEFKSAGQIERVLSLEDYHLLTNREGTWIAGWQEVGPFQQLNENAFLEVGQIDPYVQAFYGVGHELTVDVVLEDHFEKRSRNSLFPNYAHMFKDLLDCVAMPGYLSLPSYVSKTPGKSPWRRFCVHDYAHPPPVEQYRIYYILLVKINTLYKLYCGKRGKTTISAAFRQRIMIYIASYQPLMNYIRQSSDYSDAALNKPLYACPRLGILLSPLMVFYPWPVRSHRATDLSFVQHTATLYHRADPLVMCQRYYATKPQLFKEVPEFAPTKQFNLPVTITQAEFADSLRRLEHAVDALRKIFETHRRSLATYGLPLVWQNPLPRRRPSDAKFSESQRRTELTNILSYADTIMSQNFAQISAWTVPRETRYQHLLSRFSAAVLCEFNATVVWLDKQNLSKLLSEVNCFAGLLGPKLDAELSITPDGINGRPWGQHIILLACLLRAYVLEQLHSLEPVDHKAIRYQLILLRNSHLPLFRHIVSQPDKLVTDIALRALTDSSVCVLEHFYPYPTAEVHQGSLPNYANSLFYVNFFADGGMDNFPWPKAQYKKPDRACDLREFSGMLHSFIEDHNFYRHLLLELELSLKGLYEHCTVRPSFGSSVILDELFDNADSPEMKTDVIKFLLSNESLVRSATSESLCYLLTKLPSLLHHLTQVYGDWFAWRVYANMDAVRHCFSVEQSFDKIQHIVFDTINLQRHRKVFRLTETDFVVWLCDFFKKANEHRNKKLAQQLPDEAAVSPEMANIIQLFVSAYSNLQELDARDLMAINLEPPTLEVLARLHESFASRVATKFGFSNKTVQNNDELIRLIVELDPAQYCIAHRFLTLLRDSRSVRCIKTNNQLLLEQQAKMLHRNAIQARQIGIPLNAIRLAFCTACKNVKNSWPARVGTPSTGYEDVAYDVENNIYVCSKKRHRLEDANYEVLQELLMAQEAELLKLASSLPDTKESRTIQRRAASFRRKHDRELLRPDCTATELLTLPMFGNLIEMDICKVPGAKRISNSLQAGSIKHSPMPCYFLTPCCGIIYSYKDSNWYPGGYACGVCPEATAAAKSFKVKYCSCCRCETETYTTPMVWDDLYIQAYRHIIVCDSCTTRLRHLSLEKRAWSAILLGLEDESFINTVLL